tara:strand:- start:3239 stop:4843 length:1605 start_codon:yes stop_codon:yes gene_type:complete
MNIIKTLILFLSLFLISCNNSVSKVDAALEEQILYFGNGTEPKDLDPHTVTGVPESHILMALLEGLVTRHPEGLDPIPGVAESWEISNDGLTYSFYLRENAVWSNGDSVTANDFVWAWERMLTPSLGSKYPDMLYDVVNAEEFNKGTIKDFSKVGVKAINEKELLVNLKHRAPYFLGLLTHYTSRPVHRPTIEKFGNMDTIGSQWTRPGNFVGNGPFTLEDWQLNKVLKVKKSNNYWNAEKVRLNEIHFFPVDNATREDLMFRNGLLHVTSTVPLEKVEVYAKEYPDLIHIDPYFGTYYLRVNVNKEPFNNKLVRKALSLSIDRKEIVERVAKGGQIPAFSFTPPDPNNYYPPTSLDFNPELARSLLEKAGLSEKNFPTFELLYNTSEGHQKLAQAFQQMWKQNLNIDAQLINTDWKVYLSRQTIGDYSIARAGWIGDYLDPKTFLDMMVTGRGNNQTGWSNDKYDKLLQKAAKSKTKEERFNNFYEAEKILMDELPIIPIYTYTRIYMLKKDVKGWSPNLLDSHPYQFLYLER